MSPRLERRGPIEAGIIHAATAFLDEESFFVRHAYFTGANEPYEKLQRALRAEIDEEAWSSLHKTISRPFDPPATGKIAVKVINHFGDEVLNVYQVP